MEGENPQSQNFDYEADEIDDRRFDANEDNDLSLTHFLGSAASGSITQIEHDDIDADYFEADDIDANYLDGHENKGYKEIDNIVPTPGMKFKDENEIFEFYKYYAYEGYWGSQCIDSVACASGSILDPKYTKRKGAPRKLRRKGNLENSSSKSKSSCKVPTNPTNAKMSKRHKKGVSSTFTVEDTGRQGSFEVL